MTSARIIVFVVLCVTLSGRFAEAGEPLPYLDVRLQEDGQPRPETRAALHSVRGAAEAEARHSAKVRLEQTVPGVRVDDHEFFGTPHFVASWQANLTGPAPAGAADGKTVTQQFIAAHPALFEINPTEIDRARVDRDFYSPHNGARHLIYQQQIGGVDLYGCEVRANVSARGELINISSTMIPRPAEDFRPPAAVLSPLEALRAAAENIGVKMTVDPQPLATPQGATQQQTWTPTPDFRADEPITTELIYFPLTRTEIRPAWSLVLPEIGIGNTYEMMVDAVNGQVLRRWNRLHFATTEPMTFRIYTSDGVAPGSPGTPTPSGAQFPVALQPDVTVNPGDISAINPDGWMNDGVNETQGNNVDAHTDLDANNSPDLPRPAGAPYRQFLFTHDPAQAPSTAANRSAAVVQLFYLCNNYHDRLWELGFNEAAKNFQINNFGRGGVGNDRVQADAQDGSGTNNANFSTSGSDGSSARCQMYIFTGPNPDRDGDFDADIVYHELSHGLSVRLSNGTLSGSQSGGMGEGWGDYFGVSLNAEPGDDPHAVYTTGGFTTYQLWGAGYTTNYYFGIRRYPYSTDLGKSPLTYADCDTAQLVYPAGIPRNTNITTAANQVHNVGEIWCNALLACRARLWDRLGFPANGLMMQLVVDGLKLMPSNPNMLQVRNAILQADQNNNGGANRGDLWAGFASRGMGLSATSPSGSSTSGIVEAFDVPVLVSFVYPDGLPSQLQPQQPAVFRVNVSGQGTTPTPDTGELFYSINGGPFSSVAMVQGATNEYTATLPAAGCFDRIRFYTRIQSSDGPVTDPANAPTGTYSAQVYTALVEGFVDDVEVDRGWSMGMPGDTATTGQWVRGNPIGTAAQPEDAHSPVNCFFTGQGSVGGSLGEADVDNGFTTLMTPVLDMSAAGEYVVGYWRWYSNTTGANPNTDTFRVDISNNNGASWTNAETIGAAFGGQHTGGWFYHEFRVADFVAPTAQVRVRFIADDDPTGGTGSLIEAAVDDLRVTRRECQVPVVCTRGDVNDDGLIDGLDVVRFVEIVSGGGGTAVEHCAGDLGDVPNQSIDPGDVENFVACVLSGGGC